MRPIVIVPGFGGSKLVRKGDKNNRNRVFNFDILDRRWKKDFHFTFDKVDGIRISDSLEPYKFGKVDGVVNLCEDCERLDKLIVKVTNREFLNDKFGYKYMSDMTKHLGNKHGYENGKHIYGAPYDFRKVMLNENYMYDLKLLIEKAVSDCGSPAVLVAHSIGCLLASMMLIGYTTGKWRRRHVHQFLSIGGPYGGCSVSACALIFGHPLFSKISKHLDDVLQSCSGLALSFPNYLGYGLETPVFYDHRQDKAYNVFMTRQLLSECMNHLLYTYIDPRIDMVKENVDVDTKIIYTSCKDTPFSYVIHKDESVEVMHASGDGVVPTRSLTLHYRYNYKNYSFYNIPDTDHSKILYHPTTFSIIDSSLEL
jgi:hypothetical protein